VHDFSLLHDDVIDGDVERRHRQTVWALEGAPAAILAGDEMLSVAYAALLDPATGPHGVAAARLLAATVRDLIRGQFEDVAFEHRDRVSLDECLAMADGKTAALLSASTAIGAVLAGADVAVVDALAAFGRDLGIAFQIVDDLLGIWGDPGATGKAVGADLRARKKTLPVSYALARPAPAAAALAALLAGQEPLSDSDVARASALVEECGGRHWAEREADRRLTRAEAALSQVELVDAARAELVALARFVGSRDH
jgi:geranylgeranyl diphosphate synthase type I